MLGKRKSRKKWSRATNDRAASFGYLPCPNEVREETVRAWGLTYPRLPNALRCAITWTPARSHQSFAGISPTTHYFYARQAARSSVVATAGGYLAQTIEAALPEFSQWKHSCSDDIFRASAWHHACPEVPNLRPPLRPPTTLTPQGRMDLNFPKYACSPPTGFF